MHYFCRFKSGFQDQCRHCVMQCTPRPAFLLACFCGAIIGGKEGWLLLTSCARRCIVHRVFLGFAGGPSALVGCKSCSPSEPSTSPSRIGEWPFAFFFFYEMRLPSSCGLRGRNDKDLRSIFLRYVRAYSGIAWKKVMKFVCTPPGVITPKS